MDAAGTAITFTPLRARDYHGEVRFAYEASDGTTTSQAQVVGTVTPVADAPVATDDAFAMAEDDGPRVLDLLGNDTDADGDQLTVATIEGREAVAGLEVEVTADGNPVTPTNPAVGTVSVDAAGAITFTPTQDYHGEVRFAYEASDGTATSQAQVVGTVTPVADAPVAADDAFTMAEDDAPRVLDLLGNDTDADGDQLTVATIEGQEAVAGLEVEVTADGNPVTANNPAVGTVTVVDASGTIRFEPSGDYHGEVRFAYEATDGTTRSAAQVVGTVTPVADAPVAADDAFTMAEDAGPLVLDLLGNDTDADGDQLTVATIEGQGNAPGLERSR